MINESVKLNGVLEVILRDANGNIKQQNTYKNRVVTTGLSYIASRMGDGTGTAMSNMAIGSGTTATTAGDTALGTELTTTGANARPALTSTTVSGVTVVYVAAFGAGVGTGAVTEAGIFNAATAGTMLCRTVFAVVNKGETDTLTLNWTITLAGQA